MEFSEARVRITGISPYSQSRKHDADKLKGEGADAYDERTWREKMTLTSDGKSLAIPQHGMHQSISAAAKYSKRQIPGQGKATWTAKFTAGIAIMEEISLGIDPSDVRAIALSVSSKGIRGAYSGSRVTRRFPITPAGWSATFGIVILDPIITSDVMREMLDIAGMFVGVGRFRPETGGNNGRFRVDAMEWHANQTLGQSLARAA